MRFYYRDVKFIPERDEQILKLCNNKSVLHIGATDSPFTMKKYGKERLLHQKLACVAKELTGIDVDEQGIDFLRKKGITNILKMDMNELGTLPSKPEVIVFTEIIEHLSNIEICLKNIQNAMSENTRLIISTPNLYGLYMFLKVLIVNFESHHDDHKVGFTFGLLAQLLEANDFKITQAYLTFLNREREFLSKKAWRLISRFRKGFAESILVECNILK